MGVGIRRLHRFHAAGGRVIGPDPEKLGGLFCFQGRLKGLRDFYGFVGSVIRGIDLE